MSNIIRINLCGKTQVVTEDGVALEKLGGVKPRQVLEMLALSVGRPLSKDRLAQLLWDEEPPPSYVGTLESYVCVLRRILGSKGRDSVIQTTTTGYLLRRDRVVVDIDMARRLLTRARTARAAEAERLVDSALAMLDGDLLASEPNAAWAHAQRTVHERETVDLLTDVAAHALGLGEPALALRLAAAVTRRDRLAERAWQIQLQALTDQRRYGEALAGYASLRETLRDELGTEPTAETRRLYEEVLSRSRHQDAEGSSRAELATLVRLLRQALESTPGIRVPDRDEPLTALAVRVLQTA
ncbi:MAG: hypothetical protein HOQ22_18275 [Nocardioidaceae bacterium]|nr:hypothetical protein [Nocardioidaceae bacterium]NUS52972.1 hypothetical protein [Nocardioidaceae bacterium]